MQKKGNSMTPENLDKWKILPRFMMLAMTVMSWRVVEWYMTLPDPTVQQSGLVSIVMGALTGAFAVWMNKESKTDRTIVSTPSKPPSQNTQEYDHR